MKKSMLSVAVAVMLSVAWYVGRVQGQQDQKVIFESASKAKFEERMKGVSMAVIWGDPNSGALGAAGAAREAGHARHHT